ncbi:zinc-binding alcohol dehydrogenase family protein [Psychrobacter sp. NG25]|uniref:zinc-binding alcohol dehydrogenase family protein n=1 Tax=Psychrobacter sp. NG25 TaxID=2782005 RepID=UPI00188466E8|nr:zinc-binding alcohol dehydrogenase family protein [Psychrobacter sp. NG25]MBF0657744.1 zinc-binding alcohol dehydrogenase family protein [Psychrobacter sp. NG25]
MKAIGYQDNLPINNEMALQDITIDKPVASGRDILVEVKAISVNPVDYKIREARPAAEGEFAVIGWDAAGVVTAIGEDVSLFSVGDRVYYAGDLTRSGSNAEYQLVDERIVGRMPESLSFSEAAALPLTTITAWEMLFDRLQVPVATSEDANENSAQQTESRPTILVVGAAGGVGSIMTQLLKTRTQAVIIGTASRDESVKWLKTLGADYVINHHNPLSDELKKTGIAEIDYVVSLNNTEEHYAEIIKCLKPQGKLGLIDDPKALDINALKPKSLSLHWEFMFARSMFNTPDMIEQHHLLNQVATMIDAGKLKTTVAHELEAITANNLRRAHQMLENREAHGKIVLEGWSVQY